MAKGEQKSGRENKKPKQQKSSEPKSDYAKRQAGTSAAAPFLGKKK